MKRAIFSLFAAILPLQIASGQAFDEHVQLIQFHWNPVDMGYDGTSIFVGPSSSGGDGLFLWDDANKTVKSISLGLNLDYDPTSGYIEVVDLTTANLLDVTAFGSQVVAAADANALKSLMGTVSWSSIGSTPTSLTGYGISDGVSTATTYSNPSWITGLAWSKLSGVPSTFTPSTHTHTASDVTDFTSAARGAISLTTTGSGAATYNSGVLNIPTPASVAAPAVSVVTPTLGTGVQSSTTRWASVSMAVRSSATLTLAGGQSSTVTFQYADDSAFTTNVVSLLPQENGNNGTLVVGISITQVATFQWNVFVPPGKYWRLSATGNSTLTPQAGQVTLLF